MKKKLNLRKTKDIRGAKKKEHNQFKDKIGGKCTNMKTTINEQPPKEIAPERVPIHQAPPKTELRWNLIHQAHHQEDMKPLANQTY